MTSGSRIFLALGLTYLLFSSGCDQSSVSSSPIFFEFKQQPGDSYVYSIHDEVDWTIEYPDGQKRSYQRWQDQKCVMKFIRIDSCAVRTVELTFQIVFDSVETEISWMKERESLAGDFYPLHLKMRPNGEILSVESEDPRHAFFFNSGYLPSQLVFPKGPISVGYSWNHSSTVAVPRGEPAKVTTTFTFEGIEPIGEFECAVISFKASIEYTEKIQGEKSEEPVDYDYRTYSATSSSEGRLFFAYREGFLVKKENLITSLTNHCLITGKMTEMKSRTKMKDRETITLAKIGRSDGESVHFQFDQTFSKR